MRILLSFLAFCGLVFGLEVGELNLKTDNISGKFNEEMILGGFDEPIKSSGEFEIKNKELIWHIKEPLESSVKIAQNGIFSLENGKWELQKNSLMDKELFLAIFSLDFGVLQKDFDISLSGESGAWELNLSPKGAIFKEIFKNITIKGGEMVREIAITNAQGDETRTLFSDVK